MQQQQFEFKTLDNEEKAQIMTQIFLSGAFVDNVFQKTYSQRFITDLFYHIESNSIKVKSKFYAILVLRNVILKSEVKFISLLLKSSQFLELLQKIVMKVDPRKAMGQKGKNTFPDDKEGFGNRYITILLETLVFLGKRYPKAEKEQPTKFRKILMLLESQNVTIPNPQTFVYYPKLQTQQRRKEQSKNPQQIRKQKIKMQEQKKQKSSSLSVGSIIRFARDKIEIYMSNLEDAQQEQTMQEIIIKTHEIMKGQLNKFDEIGESVFEKAPNQSQQDHETVVGDYLKIREFLEEEKKLYDIEIGRNDFAAYYSLLKIKYESLFPNTQQKSNINPNTTPGNNRQTQQSNLAPPTQKNPNIPSTQSVIRQSKAPQIPKKQNIEKSQINKTRNTQQSKVTKSMVSQMFHKLEQRSKSPRGFIDIRKSLDKQKTNIQAHPPSKVKEPKTSSNQSPYLLLNKNAGSSSLQNSKIKQSTFQIPNKNPPKKNYVGTQIPKNKQLQQILYSLKKQQGHKRFKASNLKSKGLLYDDEMLEIGFKSQCILEQYDGFNTFIALQLYFGNKTSKDIYGLEAVFQGDTSCLIYTNPKQIPSFISSSTQLKHQVMVIPTTIPFNFINLRLTYNVPDQTIHTTIALPNSILKLSSQIQLTKAQYESYWTQVTEMIRTDQFRLSHHILPNSLTKYFSNLLQLTKYNQFKQPGSTTDYQLCALIVICQNYQFLLKITIRPNLNVILQAGAQSPSEDGVKYMRFYIQTLQMVLQDSD